MWPQMAIFGMAEYSSFSVKEKPNTKNSLFRKKIGFGKSLNKLIKQIKVTNPKNETIF